MSRLVEILARAGATGGELRAWRTSALDAIADELTFDVALFHAGSPRVPLSTAAVRGAPAEALEGSLHNWDRWAVELERLRSLAVARAGVSTDQDLPDPKRVRAAFETAFGRPIKSVAMIHLIVRGAIVGLCALGRRRGAGFSAADVTLMETIAPVLATADALQQRLDHAALAGVPARLECRDQRLTPRQRDIVEHVALGHANAEIARALGLSPNTVRNLLAQIAQRLGACNRADVVRLAVLRPP